MTIKKFTISNQTNLNFLKENLEIIDGILKKYPKKNKKSAVMPLLFLLKNKMIIGYLCQL